MKWKATSRIMEAGDDDKINEELSYLSQRYSGFEYVDMKHIPYGNSKILKFHCNQIRSQSYLGMF